MMLEAKQAMQPNVEGFTQAMGGMEDADTEAILLEALKNNVIKGSDVARYLSQRDLTQQRFNNSKNLAQYRSSLPSKTSATQATKANQLTVQTALQSALEAFKQSNGQLKPEQMIQSILQDPDLNDAEKAAVARSFRSMTVFPYSYAESY
jgi:hypothetical protein